MSSSSFFDRYYYEHGCGRPYERDEAWLNFFDGIAKRIIEESEPKTVLDAGCALGFLVEAFRNRGIDAFGVDISTFAIENVYPDIKPYCWVGSVCEPFPQKYDLITSIEVLEHLAQPDSEKAIANLCAHANEIVFSSTPFDYKESTHFNVQPPEYWAEQFARYGFYRDLESDMSFITPWAVKFVKNNRTTLKLVREYERKFWYLWKENTDLRSLSSEMRQNLSEQDDQLKRQTARVMALSAELNTDSWKLVLFLRKIQKKFFPPNSWREKLVRFVYSTLKIWRRSRLIALMRKIMKRLALITGIIRSDYEKWILNNEPKAKQLVEQRAEINNFNYMPLVSIIMPVWNTPAKILNQTFKSVVDQTYDKWELCIADGNSNSDTKKVLSYWAKKDRRIRIKFLNENKGIAANSNEALLLAQGEFVAFLDHDDLLAPFALFEVVNALQMDANVDVVYSDEDKTNESGRRFDPFFKPDFSPDYLRSVNYMTHFLVVRKSLEDQAAWFREGYDGAQDYDLILRLVEKARVVAHIPKILYHWRVWASSAASGSDAKPYANASGKKALQEHLTRESLSAQVEDGFHPTFYHVRYQLAKNPLISIIIPNQDHALDLERCVNSILQKTTYPNFEIILVENGSREQKTFNMYKYLERDSRIHLMEWNEPFNYSRVNNWAAEQANGEVFLFLNNDTQIINNDWLEQMLQFAMRSDVGAIGAKLYYPDESIQHAGVIIGLGGIAGHGHKNFPRKQAGYFGSLISVQNVSAVTAACLMIRKQVFQEVNGFNEEYALAFGDVDLCLKILQKGYLNVWTPYAELYHYESKTRGGEDTPEKQARFRKEVDYFRQEWTGILERGDEYYNPNLSLEREDFSIDSRKKSHPARLFDQSRVRRP